MLLDRIYRKVKYFVNTDVYGNVKPTKFEGFVHDAIQSRNEEYFYDENRSTSRANRGMIIGGLANIPSRIREKISHYSVDKELFSDSSGIFTLPDNYRYLDTFENSSGTTFEFCDNNRAFSILKGSATLSYPIALLQSNKIKTYPVFIPENNEGGFELNYLRKISYPKWTYQIIDDVEIFNPDSPDFVDADIHPSEEDEIVRRVLLRFGITLKTSDIVAYAVNDEKSEFNENNAS